MIEKMHHRLIDILDMGSIKALATVLVMNVFGFITGVTVVQAFVWLGAASTVVLNIIKIVDHYKSKKKNDKPAES